MAETDRFRQVGDEFKLANEVLVVVTDADGEADQAQAIVFWRDAGKVNELEPTGVDDALDQAKQTARKLRREIVVQRDNDETWWPHWGTLDPPA